MKALFYRLLCLITGLNLFIDGLVLAGALLKNIEDALHLENITLWQSSK